MGKKIPEHRTKVKPGVLTEQQHEPKVGGLAEHLREAIETCGLSPYEIARRAGIAPQQIYRFMSENKTLTLETVDKLLPIVSQSFRLRINAVEIAEDEMARMKQEMISYLAQVQDKIRDLRTLVEDGLSPGE